LVLLYYIRTGVGNWGLKGYLWSFAHLMLKTSEDCHCYPD